MAKYADITPFYEWLEGIMREDKTRNPDHNTLMFYEIIDELDSLPELVPCDKCERHMICPIEEQLHRVKAKNRFCGLGERREGE